MPFINLKDFGTEGVLLGTRLTNNDQKIHETSLTQHYTLGTIIDLVDGRRYRYAKTGTGGVVSEMGAANADAALVSAVVPAQDTGCGTAGSQLLTVTVGASVGRASGLVVLNELVGGYVTLANGSAQHPEKFRITSNTATTNAGGTMIVGLDRPIVTAVTATTTYSEVFYNPYSALVGGSVNSAYVTFMGIPAVTAAVADTYFWLQTKGPCWITSDGDTGKTANVRMCYFVNNGSITGDTGDVTKQPAGLGIDLSTSGASNSPLIMLMLE